MSVVKHFTDDASLFLVVHDPKTTGLSLNGDLLKLSQWVYQWKMFFNPDTSKQAREIAFTCKKI